MDKLINAANASLTSNEISLYEHNEMLYNEICKELNNGERSIGYTEATGLGKSYIFMKLVYELFVNKRVLYIAPKNAIIDNMSEYKEFNLISKCVTFATYAAFNSEQDAISMADNYDVIFADECHHLQSDIQGNNIRLCMNKLFSNGGWVFGMTATPDFNDVEVIEEYFDKAIYGYDLVDAIEEGILPKLNYHIAIPDNVDIPDSLRKKYSVDSTKTMLEQVLAKHYVDRWIVFFTNQKELFDAKESLNKILPNHEVLIMCTLNEDNTTSIQRYNSTDRPVILLTVSMALEGIHLRDVQGIIIYRNATKTSVWFQMVGRVFSAFMKHSPVIVDVTASIRILSKKKRVSHKANEIGRPIASFRDIIEVSSSSYDTIDFLEELISYNRMYVNYRGIVATSIASLMSQLGKSDSAYYSWKSNNPEGTYEMIIDYMLEKKEKYRGVTLNSYNHIFTAFGIKRSTGYAMLSENKINTMEEFIDFALDTMNLTVNEDNALFVQKSPSVFTPVNYRGITADTATELSIKLGRARSWYSGLCNDKEPNVEDLIDEYLDGPRYIVDYKGYKAYNKRELSLLLGRNKSYVASITARCPDITYEEIIDQSISTPILARVADRYLDNGMTLGIAAKSIGCSHKFISAKFDEGVTSFYTIKKMYDEYMSSLIIDVNYKGFTPCSKKEFADKLGISVNTVNRYIDKEGYTPIEVIDAVSSGVIRSYKEQTYRGVTWARKTKLDKLFGFRKGHISQYREYRGLSDKEIIDKVFDAYPEIRSKFEQQ